MKSQARGQQRTLWNQFTQQRLKAWQPILAPGWIISIYIICGVLFLALGIVLLLTSWSVEEYVKDYTDEVTNPATGVGSFDIEIMRDMEPPIWIYYQLDGFHQNHRRYVNSRDDKQLREAQAPKYSASGVPLCSPWIESGDGRINYPCGLVARSVFDDTYAIIEGDGDSPLEVDTAADTIAWATDTDGKFQNVDPEALAPSGLSNSWALDMWILKKFPPVACEQRRVAADAPFLPATVAVRRGAVDGAPLEVADCRSYMDAPVCNFTLGGVPFDCTGNYRTVDKRNDWGIQNGHFIVWMRISGLPSFRKLWGRVNRPIRAGTTLTVHFQDNYRVKEFRGRKAFVISTSSKLGGRNDFLGYGYMVVGSCCLLFGIVFLCRYTWHGSRPLGDPTLLAPPER